MRRNPSDSRQDTESATEAGQAVGRFLAPLALQTAAGEISPRRLALLAAIEQKGSISAAARSIGITYKAAWDAVEAMNNLAGRPLIMAQHGGRGGGGAGLTDEGRQVTEHWRQLQSLQQVWLERMQDVLPPAGWDDTLNLMRRITMRSSARNILHGIVEQVVHGAVSSEVSLRLSGGDRIHAMVTRESAEELELAPESEAQALIKASWIILADTDEGFRSSARNRLQGKVRRLVEGEVNAEVILELRGGNTLAATVTRAGLQTMNIKVGDEICALIKASHVILGVNS